MSEHYTGDEYQKALLALLKVDEEFPRDHRPMDAAVTAVLDAVAPAIAARALREAARAADGKSRDESIGLAGRVALRGVAPWLVARAQEIEAAR